MELSSSNHKRTDDKDFDVERGITRSKYWFDDGNVIIQAENTQFRVHRSILCRHSTIFKHVFDMPQPPQTDPCAELYDCPVIPLTDNARDFEYLMSIFYDNVRVHDIRFPISLDQCAAILRLGKKYDIEYLLDEGLRRFRNMFPDTLAGWNGRDISPLPWERIKLNLVGEPFFYERAMALAYELSINRALPGICLSLIKKKGADGILRSVERHSPTEDDYCFVPHLLMNCVKGQNSILCQANHRVKEWVDVPSSSPIPSPNCTKIKSCVLCRTRSITTLTYGDDGSFSGIGPFRDYPLTNLATVVVLNCTNCTTSIKTAIKQLKSDLWNDLPSLFGIGDRWEDLKDFDS